MARGPAAVPAVGASGTLVGTLTGGQSYSDGTGTAAAFNFPSAVAFDSAGTAYVADQWNNTIRKVTASGTVTTLAGTTTPGYRDGSGEVALFDNPAGIAVDGAGIVYVAEQGTSNTRIRKIDPAGNVTTYAGNGTAGFADGAAATARFNLPTQLALDGSGNLYVADRNNHRIRRISPSGTVTTVAGSGVAGYADGSGTAAQLSSPTGVASDAAGNLVVVELNQRPRSSITA